MDKNRILVYGVLLLPSFIIVTRVFCLHGVILEKLSNQCRSKKIGDDRETKETEPNVLQRQENKGAKG